MKTSLMAMAAAASLLIVTGAHAADVSMPEPMTDWSGFFIGAHLGYGVAEMGGGFDTDESDREDKVLGEDLDLSGVLGGVQVGYNHDLGAWVMGVEGDISFLGYSDKTEDQDEEDDGTDYVEADVDWLGSLRGRIGMKAGTALIYGTGGVAFAGGSWEACDCEGETDNGDVDLSPVGFVAGGGIEVELGESWSMRAEGLYYGFGQDEDTSDLTDDSGEDDHAGIDNIWAARVGLNYRF